MKTQRASKFIARFFVTFLLLVGVAGLIAISDWESLRTHARSKTVNDKVVTLSDWEALRTGNYFRAVDKWLADNFIVRSTWASIDRQISYTLFSEIPPRTEGTRIIASKGDWLFEHQYISESLTPSSCSWTDADTHANVARLLYAQTKLKSYGIPLLYVFGPSKVEIYPEHVPESFFKARKPSDVETVYEKLRPLLQKAGVQFYDGRARFSAWKAEGKTDLFARSGTHWSYLASYNVLKDLREILNPQMKRKIPELKANISPPRSPVVNDRDLLVGSNLLLPEIYVHNIPFPELPLIEPALTEQAPRILWIHDSFGWQLVDLLYGCNAIRPGVSLYYFDTYMEMPGQIRKPIDPSGIDWIPFLKGFDAVIVVETEIANSTVYWKFLNIIEKIPPAPPTDPTPN